jgi:ABC-type spermidine/putrescine transport system permease subunit II
MQHAANGGPVVPEDVSAFELLLTGDPALLAIVRLSLMVSLSAVVVGGLIGVPVGAGVALTRFPGREGVIVILNALMGLPPVVVGLAIYLLSALALGAARIVGSSVHPAGDDRRPDRAHRAHHGCADAANHRGFGERIPR